MDFFEGLETVRRGCIEQRPSEKLKANRTMVKASCLTCGYWTRTSPYWMRKWTGPKCDCCGGIMLPARVEDCAEYLPALLPHHPDYADYVRGQEKARKDYGSIHDPACCPNCAWPRPENADPNIYHCPKCRGVVSLDHHGERRIEFPKDPFRSHAVKIARENARQHSF